MANRSLQPSLIAYPAETPDEHKVGQGGIAQGCCSLTVAAGRTCKATQSSKPPLCLFLLLEEAAATFLAATCVAYDNSAGCPSQHSSGLRSQDQICAG